jgi:hypothetical protein
MGRRLLGVIVALVTAAGIFFLFVMVASAFAPQPPKNFEYISRAQIAEFMSSLPLTGYVMASFGGLLASLAAGWMVTKISKEWRSVSLPVLVGILLTVGGIGNYVIFGGQPVWFLAACIVITLPFALIGHRIAR